MATFGNGKWKEGRLGAASLCYENLRPQQLETVATHHAAVGIRATLGVTDTTVPLLQTLASRNWDLAAIASASPGIFGKLHTLDGKASHGLLLGDATSPPAAAPDNQPTPLYRVGNHAGQMAAGAALPHTLPAVRVAGDQSADLFQRIQDVVEQEHWAIWRLDAAAIDAMGTEAHQRLLRQLGDEHARTWCAPIRDIAGHVAASV